MLFRCLKLLGCVHLIVSCTPKSTLQQNDAVAPSRAMTNDEAKPPFVDLPHLEVAPLAGSLETSPNVPTGPVTSGQGQLGIDPLAACESYVEKYWKIGAETQEEAAGPFGTKINFTSRVVARTANQVTVHSLLQTADTSQNIDEQVTFNACTEGPKMVIPSGMTACTTVEIGEENVVVEGRNYKTRKFRIGPCSNTKGKTYDTFVWRANEIALWGIVKREVRGSIVPDLLNGLIAAQTLRWAFGP